MSDEDHGGLDGLAEALESAEFERESRRDELLDAWDKSKRAITGSIVSCPVCHSTFRKTRQNQAFCPVKPRKCKDRFWNTVNDERRERAIRMSQ